MSANGAFNFPTNNSLYFHPPDPASSGLGSSSQSINPNVSTNPPSSSRTLSIPSSSTTDPSFFGHFVPLNNSTNNATSAQPLPSHDASGLQLPTDLEQNPTENMPPSQSATVASGSKRKADLDGNISGPSLKKARALPIEEPFQNQFIPQESRAWPELARHIPNQQPQGAYNGAQDACNLAEITPEIAAIHVELNGLVSFPVHPSVELPSCGHLLTAVILRGDVPRLEFYPYLWFHGRPPYMLKGEDYGNIFPESSVGAMQNALRRLGIFCETLGLTASRHRVLFFEREERKVVQDAVKKKMGTTFNNARWQGANEIPAQNHAVAFIGQQQNGAGPNASQSNSQSGHQSVQHPQSGPSLHSLPNNLTMPQIKPNGIPPQPQRTGSSHGRSVGSQLVRQQASDSVVVDSSVSSQTRSATPRHPVQNPDPFVFVSNDAAKRRRNNPSTGIPDTPQAASGPSAYPSNTVFAETHTKESFPHPQNTNAAAAPKRQNRRRAPANSTSERGRNAATATQQQSQLEHEGEVAQKPKAQRGKRRGKKAQDQEPLQFQAGPSGSKEPETRAPQQVSKSICPQENTQASSSYTQHQIGYTAAMTQALVPQEMNQFGLADTLGGRYYAPLDVANQNSQAEYPDIFYQHSTPNIVQSSFPELSTSDQTGYGDLTAAAVSTVNPAIFPTFTTGYEVGGATTSQTSPSQPSDQVAHIDHAANLAEFTKILATGEHAEASYPNVPLYAQYSQEPDANRGSNLSDLTDQGYQQFITPTLEQNLTYDGFPQAFYLQPQGFAPAFSEPSAGGFPGDGQAWNFNGV